ncbi:SDR family oxidoreductase [Marinitenerispora sediminis]|uniref:Oxidoreductase n=1 Tax=Marinitenerispora sediminis TaxID=1931232 RepID=A0A368T1C5_9ACTN|nr:SDR family oxidoreductase [Marinitenerispora sediminis]RCV52781.1 oxidoreductase [Marinitenerispora sediminis]RCV53743.1 oxidoreductase [Marinitenerispora sediminis]RCV54076.1 oxidoreductase [Marinitenerispora sediminis]
MSGAVLVTGATGGIGRAIAMRLARDGWRVIGTTRDQVRAEELLASARRHGVTLRTVLMDVTDAASRERAFGEALELSGGRLRAVVNNAGMAMSGTVEDVSEQSARDVLELNLLGPAQLARLALPVMRDQGGGRIVNVSSLSGRVATPMIGWYCASKHGLEALSDAMRMEAERDGVRVVIVQPGCYPTELWNEVFTGMAAIGPSAYADCYRLLDAVRPWVTGRLPSSPEPVARAVRRALTDPRPRARYAVGVDARVALAAERLLPGRAADAAKQAVVGLRAAGLWRLLRANRPLPATGGVRG